jgi:hypothetical protein
MKRIIKAVVVTALIASTQSAWSIVRDRHEWLPSPQVEAPFPADAEASYNLPALDTYSDKHKGDREQQTGDPFPLNLAGVMIDD